MARTVTAGTSGPRPPRRHRYGRWAAIAAVLVVLLVGAGFWATRNRARPVSLGEARQRMRASATTVPAGSSSTTAPHGDARPAEGVYHYRGSGSEKLSVPPLSQSEGPVIPGTVTHVGATCWRFRVDYSTNHWQTWNYCRRAGDLVEQGGRTWQRWIIGVGALTNLSDFTCDPAAMAVPAHRKAGEVWSARCVGSNQLVKGAVVSVGPYREVGTVTLTIGGRAVRAVHFVRHRTMSGAQRGTEVSDVWFDADTGLPLRNERRIQVKTDTPVGESTYTERGGFSLVSLTPTT